MDELHVGVMDANSEVTSDASDVYVQRFDKEYSKEEKKKLKEAQNAKINISKKIYNLNNPHENSTFLSELKKISYATPYKYRVVSPYFGFYFLSAKEQKKYLKKITDKDGKEFTGLMVDTFDPKGYEKLKNSKEYTVAMLKVNVQSYGTARDYFQKNGLKSGTVTLTNPKIVSQNFVSHSTIAKVIPDPLGVGAAITNGDGLNITLRRAGVKSYIKINVTKENSKGEKFVTITRYTRIGDKFVEPLNLMFGLPDKGDKGTPYTILTNYEKHEKYKNARFVVKGKTPNQIIKEINTSIETRRNEEMRNVKLKDILMESLKFREENRFKYKYINPIF